MREENSGKRSTGRQERQPEHFDDAAVSPTTQTSGCAEGNGRFSIRDYLRHLSMSNASLRELQSDLHFLRRKNATDTATKHALERSYVVAKLLMKLVASLRRKRDDETG